MPWRSEALALRPRLSLTAYSWTDERIRRIRGSELLKRCVHHGASRAVPVAVTYER